MGLITFVCTSTKISTTSKPSFHVYNNIPRKTHARTRKQARTHVFALHTYKHTRLLRGTPTRLIPSSVILHSKLIYAWSAAAFAMMFTIYV